MIDGGTTVMSTATVSERKLRLDALMPVSPFELARNQELRAD